MALKNKPSSRMSGISLRTKLIIGSALATAVGLMFAEFIIMVCGASSFTNDC